MFATGITDSMPDINDALAGVHRNIGDLGSFTDSELQTMSGHAINFANTFDEDVSGATRAAGQLLRTGLAKDGQHAFDVLMAAAQQSSGPTDDLIDTIEEYGADFRELGLTGPQALGAVDAAVAAGARNADLAADVFREFSDIMIEGGDGAAGALSDIGLDADAMRRKILEGGPAAAQATSKIIQALGDVEDPLARNEAGIELFGTKWNDAGAEAVLAMDPLASSLKNVEGAANRTGDTLNDNAQTKIQAFTNKVTNMLAKVVEAPGALGTAATAVAGFGQVLEPVGPALAGVGFIFRDQLSGIASKLGAGISAAASWAGGIVKQGARGAASFVASTGRMIASGAVWVAQTVAQGARSAASFVVATGRMVASGAAWVARMVAQGATAVASMAATSAKFVARWAVMGAQSLLHAAKVALAWLIAMGPIALVIAAVVGLVVLIVKNWDKIVRFTKQLWEKVSDFFVRLKDSVVEAVRNLKDRVVGFFTDLKDRVVARVTALRDKAVAILRETRDRYIALVTTIRDKVVGFFRSLRDQVVAIATTIKDKVIAFFTGLKDGAIQLFTDMVDRIRGVKQTVIGFFAGAGRWLWDAGKNIVQGLIDGVKSMIGNIGDAVGSVVDKVTRYLPWSPAKEGPLKSHPPELAGRNIVDLMASGMGSGLPELMRAADAAARAAMPDVPSVTVPRASAARAGIAAVGRDGTTSSGGASADEIGRARMQADIRAMRKALESQARQPLVTAMSQLEHLNG